MEKRLFLSSEAAKIVGIAPRQILSRYERGIVKPFKESTGTGSWNKFDYINLLEFGFSETLFSIGMGFRTVKFMTNILTTLGYIREWAENFKDYYENETELMLKEMSELILKVKDNPEQLNKMERFLAKLQNQKKHKITPTKEIGVLVWSFRDKSLPHKSLPYVKMYPLGKDRVIELAEMKDVIIEDRVSILIDMGRIKDEIDQRL